MRGELAGGIAVLWESTEGSGLKLLLVADAVGGVFTHSVELARALAARGVAIVLATEGARLSADQRRALEGIPGLVGEESAYRLEWMEDPWDDVARAGRWLLGIEERERPDVVQLGSFAHGALPFRAPKLVVGHSCVLSWYEAVKGEPAPPRWDRYRAAVRAGLLGADAVAAPSAWMARALVRHHGPLPEPFVVPNGRDPARFVPLEKEEIVVAAGRLWDEAKNAAALARSAPALPWRVFIAGDEAAPGATEHTTRDASTTANPTATANPTTTATTNPTTTSTTTTTPSTTTSTSVNPTTSGKTTTSTHATTGTSTNTTATTATFTTKSGTLGAAATFLGRLPEAELARWLGRASIFAHPARYEPFGLTVLEAALAGCALVLGDVESLRESWDGAAEFANPRDDLALADRIRALARDAGRRRALAERARSRALALSPGRMAEGYLGIHRALLRARTWAAP